MLKNILLLSIVQISNYIFPLVTLPYLARTLGVSQFGGVMLAQAVIQYFIILTDYGFNLSATKKIALAENQDNIDTVYTNTFYCRVILLVCSLILLMIFINIPMFKDVSLIVSMLFLSVIGNCLYPIYLFQGLEKVKDIAWITLFSKCIMLLLVFLLVKNSKDVIPAAFAISMQFLIPGLIATGYVHYKKLAKFKCFSLLGVTDEFKCGSALFLSQIAVSFYTTFNTIILGHYYSTTIVGYYTAADKMRGAVQSLLVPIQQVVYPRINKEKQEIRRKIIHYGGLFILVSFLIALIVFFFGSTLTYYYLGPEYEQSAALFKWMSLLFPIIGLAIVYGQWGLITIGRERVLAKIYSLGAVLHCIYSIPLVKLFGLYGMLSSVLLTETIITIIMIIIFLKFSDG